MADAELKRVAVNFFRLPSGREPVREWLRDLKPVEDRKQIGNDLMAIEFGWPVGMPICRPLSDGLFEVRSSLPSGRISRVLFYIDPERRMILLHAFIKKTQKTPPEALTIARRNKRLHESGATETKS